MRGSALATRLALAAAGGFAFAGQSLAQTLEWDAGDNTGNGNVEGGAGTWDSTTVNWTNNGGNNNVDWNPGSDARFSGAGGVVTLSGVQEIDDLTFAGNGYSINPLDPASVLKLDQASANINVLNAADTATINAAITGGNQSIAVNGPGTLVLGGINTYTGLTSITGNGTLTNNGTIAGAVTVTNGNFNISATGWVDGLVTNRDNLTSSGTIDGGLDNDGGVAVIQGTVNGGIDNTGGMTIVGNLAAGGVMTNSGNGEIAVIAGSAYGFTTLTNQSTASVGITIANGAALSADEVINSQGATIENNGVLTSLTGPIENDGTLNSIGTINGGVANTGTLESSGVLNGGLTNGSLTEGGAATVSGVISGAILNQNASSLTIDGSLTANSSLTNNGTSTVEITAGNTVGITDL